MCGAYDSCTFVTDTAASEILAVQSSYSHAYTTLLSFYALRAFFKKIKVKCTNYLLEFRNADVRQCLEYLVRTR